MKAERIETVYNYDEWCRLVERHGKKILKRYICRKIRKVARFMSVVLVMYIVPLAMGGEDSLENLQATCEPCNSHKKALLPEAYFDKVNRTFVFQMNKKYSHNLLWKLSKLFIGRLEKQA